MTGTQATPRVRRGADLTNVALPLGGIGTGSISIDGGGRLRDFEIFNRPSKGLDFEFTFLALQGSVAGGESFARALQGPLAGRALAGDALGEGVRRSGTGLPHFRQAEFVGRFPFAEVTLTDPTIPLGVAVEAFNPFIPLDADASSLPFASLTVVLHNPLEQAVDATVYATLQNRAGHPDVGGGVIECFDTGPLRGLRMSTTRHASESSRFGTLALGTPHDDVRFQTHWYRGSWFDSMQDFWDQISADAFREQRTPARRDKGCDVGTIALRTSIEPGETVRLPIWIAWHTPNFQKYWEGLFDLEPNGPTWRNHYATRFSDAQSVLEHVAAERERLETQTRAFADALWQSTLPEPVLDAVTSQLSTLKTTTCLRLEDGTFWAWEGCDNTKGSCEGTCTHVWNYAQALPYLFPSLERSVRSSELAVDVQADGHMTFRTPLPLGTRPQPVFQAAADGQFGTLLRIYRDWRICGDDEWLRSIWPAARRALSYTWVAWDQDEDGVAEGLQHNTYDIEFFGPNPMTGILYLGALEAGARLAETMGEVDFAERCRTLAEAGACWIDEHLFNGEYYEQQVRPDAAQSAPLPPTHPWPAGHTEPPYQVGRGCLSDQLIGQWYAEMLGLPLHLNPEHVRAAARSIYRHNWRSELWDHSNPQRIFAHEDEGGLLLATWPHGGRPAFPFPYSDEVWTGIEYEVAALLIYLGDLDAAIDIVTAARARYSGSRRNPWSEIECGNHYARGMASYSLLLAFSGFRYSAPDQDLGFQPRPGGENFACFFSVDSGWGMLERSGAAATVDIRAGTLTLRRLSVPLASASRVLLGSDAVDAVIRPGSNQTVVELSPPVVVEPGRPLSVVG
jgi:uncharacterized protein (DUF608 family)